ncbi:MAG: hypothetical protein ACOVP4_07845 [Bacteriovoracaceae bacterium]
MWKNFTKNLPESFPEIWETLSKEGFTPILIGGVPRDYLLTGIVGDDWDMELVHQHLSFDTGLWKRLAKSLGAFGQVQFLPFDIIRLKLKTVTYEFSAPRSESFGPDWAQGGHKNFEHKLSFKLSYHDAIKRRDLTVNTIGIKFIGPQKIEVLDPLNGALHIQEKRLLPVSEDFPKDPIRFFRALRFSIKLGFSIDPLLEKVLREMPLSHASHAHVWNEIVKSKNIKKYFNLLGTYQNSHPEWKSDWLPVLGVEDEVGANWQESAARLMLWLALKGKPIEAWQNYFTLSPKDAQSFARLGESIREIDKLDPLDFHGEFDSIHQNPAFEKICDVYFTLKNMQSREAEGFVVNLLKEFAPAWQYLFSFEVIKDVRDIDPPLRARYQVWSLCQKL